MSTQKAQPTPGPWYANGIHIESDKQSVAECCFAWRGFGAPDNDTMEANARLIAASPTLADTGHRLAMMALQSERYAQDAEYRDAVDDLIEALYVAGVMQRVTP